MNDMEIIELAFRRASARVSNPDVKLGLKLVADEILQMKTQQHQNHHTDLDDEIPF